MANREEIKKLNREKLKELPIANERLYKETAFLTGVSPKQVEEVIDAVSAFTANVIRVGGFETVMIPSFGKFRVKPKQVQFLAQNETIRNR